MRHGKRECGFSISWTMALANLLLLYVVTVRAGGNATPALPASVAVGPQYDSTHVYVAPGDLDAFINSFVATFGGQPSKRSVTNVLPVPSRTEFQYLWTSVGTLSVFAFQTPIPVPLRPGAHGIPGYRHGPSDQGRSFGRSRSHRSTIQGCYRTGCRHPVAGRSENATVLALHAPQLSAA